MEAIIDEGVWSSMSSEEAELMSQLLGNCSLPNDNFVASSSSSSPAAFWEPNPNNADAALMYNSSMPCFSQAIGSGGFPFCSHENYYTLSNHNNNNTNAITESNNEVLLVGKKRSRLTCEIPSSKKSMKCSKGEASSSCSEEEPKGGRAPNPNAKTRASRPGSATDPQSLYARKRRERINERLRILQTLVPNGTKVDISTMLEEAVQYVKFLQLQIKVLSSDDMWMYAPIAYNGMDIGLDFRSQSS